MPSLTSRRSSRKKIFILPICRYLFSSVFGGWLKRIVVNECIRYGKKNFYWNEWEDERNNQPEDETEWWKTVNFEIIHREIKGLPDDYKKTHRQDDGMYKITMEYPSYIPFMKYSEL